MTLAICAGITALLLLLLRPQRPPGESAVPAAAAFGRAVQHGDFVAARAMLYPGIAEREPALRRLQRDLDGLRVQPVEKVDSIAGVALSIFARVGDRPPEGARTFTFAGTRALHGVVLAPHGRRWLIWLYY